MELFRIRYPDAQILIVGGSGIPLQEFFAVPAEVYQVCTYFIGFIPVQFKPTGTGVIFLLIITSNMSYYNVMKTSSEYFSIDELCALTGLTRRGIRFYVQKELLMPPVGLGRGAKYTRSHLEELLLILKWKNAGVTLEGIREILAEQRGEKPLPPNPRSKPGDVSVCSRIVVTDGVELLIDPERAGLSPEELRSLIKGILSLYSQIKSGSSSCTEKQSSD